MSGESVRPAVEHLSGILDRLEVSDLDLYGYDDIDGAIRSLESFLSDNSSEDDLYALRGLVSDVISHLYVARGYATPDVPRDLQYYQNMNKARNVIRQIKRMG